MNWTIWIIAFIVVALIVWTVVRRKRCGCGEGKVCEAHGGAGSQSGMGSASVGEAPATSAPTGTQTPSQTM